MGDYRSRNGSVGNDDDTILSVVPCREVDEREDVRVLFHKVDRDDAEEEKKKEEEEEEDMRPGRDCQVAAVGDGEAGVRLPLHRSDGQDREKEEQQPETDTVALGKAELAGKRGGWTHLKPHVEVRLREVDTNWPVFYFRRPAELGIANKKVDSTTEERKPACPGLGLLYTLLASVFFSIAALLVKKIQGMHAVQISAIRCLFQMLFVLPAMIYYKTGFLGPPGMRVYLFLRGFLGSNAMILLYYAVLQMPLADATVIMFSNPVFTSLLAWVFLKERCTILDVVFTAFTLTGVVLIARPPFLFGGELSGIEGNYTNHVKGTVAAFAGAIGAACTMVILRKMGRNVHYYLSVWYYAVLGFIECVAALFILDEWALPECGWDRWSLMAIGLLGIAGQIFLTKALQVEKAGPVALMRTLDVVLAFVLQFLFLNRQPTWWSVGGALCVISSTSGVALKKWYSSTRQKT